MHTVRSGDLTVVYNLDFSGLVEIRLLSSSARDFLSRPLLLNEIIVDGHDFLRVVMMVAGDVVRNAVEKALDDLVPAEEEVCSK